MDSRARASYSWGSWLYLSSRRPRSTKLLCLHVLGSTALWTAQKAITKLCRVTQSHRVLSVPEIALRNTPYRSWSRRDTVGSARTSASVWRSPPPWVDAMDRSSSSGMRGGIFTLTPSGVTRVRSSSSSSSSRFFDGRVGGRTTSSVPTSSRPLKRACCSSPGFIHVGAIGLSTAAS